MSKVTENLGGNRKTPKAFSLRMFVGDITKARKRAELYQWSLNTYIAVAVREKIERDTHLVKDNAKSPNEYFHG